MWNPFKSKKPIIKVSPFLGPAIYDEAGEFSIPIIRGGEQIFAEGYANPYIFFSVNTIASGISEVPFKVFEGENQLDEKNELFQLIQHPNPHQDFSELVYSLIANKCLFGTCAAHIIPFGKTIQEIIGLPVIRFEMTQDKMTGEPKSYTVGWSNRRKFEGNNLDQLFLHSSWNPENPFMPLSPIAVNNDVVNTSNLTIKKGYFMLENSSVPSGVMTLDNEGNVGEEVREEMKKYVRETMQGVKNSGRMLVLHGKGAYTDFKPKEADLSLLEMRKQVAKEILMIYRIPENLAFGTDSTYANLAAAKRNFQLSTLKPVGDDLYNALGRHLSRVLQRRIMIKACWDETDAAREYRAQQMERYNKIQFLSVNEKREMFGLEAKDGTEFDEPQVFGAGGNNSEGTKEPA